MSSGPPGGGTWTGLALALGGTLAAVAIAFAIPPLRHAVVDAIHGNTAEVRHDLRELGASGAAMVIGLQLIHTVIWYPAEIIDAAAGFVYGFGAAFALVMAGWVASGVLSYWVGRHAARPLLYTIAGERRFLRVERLIHRGGVTFLLAARLVPIVPFTLTGLVAGAARVPLARFSWTTAVGYAPITAYFVYVGSRLEGFSIEDPIVWAGAGGLLLMFLAVRYLTPRASEREAAREGEPSGR